MAILDFIKNVLRENHPDAKIIATAAAGEELLSLAKQQGADLLLPKPFNIIEVLEFVEQLLSS